jgi:Dual specificity phosphatase, catalytic domain
MKEVYPNLFIGTLNDYETQVAGQEGWAVVHACKEPYHRLAVGYKGWSAPRNHPEAMLAWRDTRLMLCLLDLPVPWFIRKEMIDQTLDFIDQMHSRQLKVLVHCRKGRSRSPSITLLYLSSRLRILPTESLESAEVHFRRLYPRYRPNFGIRAHLRNHWQQYCAHGTLSTLRDQIGT